MNHSTKNIKKSCIDFFQNEDIKLYVREILKPVVHILYNEIYVYIWIICLYNIFLFFFILASFFFIFKIYKNQQNKM